MTTPATPTLQERLAASRAATQQPKDPEPTAPAGPKSYAFKLTDVPEFYTQVSPKGAVVSFYRGYFTTPDYDLAKWVANYVPDVQEIDPADPAIQVAPSRSRKSTPVAQYGDPTQINPLELLQRSIANTNHTPQAGASNSQVAN